MPICKLCDQTTDKLVKSHIIPKSMYGFRHLKYDKGPTKLVPISNNLRYKKSKRIPSGVYERIFCNKCENITSKYDTYAFKILYKEKKIAIPSIFNPVGYIVKNVDKEKLLLFFASLLLRMSISANEIFKDVNLGEYEADFRNSILSGDISMLNGLDGFICFYDNELSAAFMNPYKTRIFNIMHYSISVFNYLFDIKVSDKESYGRFIENVNLKNAESDLVILKRDLHKDKNFQLIVQKLKGGIAV